eukprot:14025747-Ditylum_brightwellii.AAC.2
MGGANNQEIIIIGNWDRWRPTSIHVLGKKKVHHISYDSSEDALNNKDNYEILTNFREEYFSLLNNVIDPFPCT